MTCMYCLVYLVFVTALALGSETETLNKPQTEPGNTSHEQVVVNQHLFIAGNDSTGTAAITFTSRLDPWAPTIHQFVNYSFPHSCTSHPTRCRNLTYMSYRDNSTSHTRLIFYVPLMGPNSAGLGLMEFWHDGETISQNATRVITTDQCDPVSVVRIPRIGVYLICASSDYSLKLCEVKNRNNVSSAWLSCTAPHSLNQLLLPTLQLSNFIVYISNPSFDLYFVYNNVLYQMTNNAVTYGIANLQTSKCHYVHLAPVNASFLIGHCYERNQVEAFYFYLDTHDYIPTSQDGATVANYHCPTSQQFVTLYVPSQLRITQASFQDRGVNRGRFNFNASQVTFAECFNSRNQSNFIYQDSELGIFIKPNISIGLHSRLVRVSDLRCQACKQPLIFNDRYLVIPYDMDDIVYRQGMMVLDLYEELNRTLTLVSDSNSTAQVAFFSEFTKRVPVHMNVTRRTPKKKVGALVIAICVVLPFVLLGVIFLVVVLIRIKHCRKGEGTRRCCRPYAPVAGKEDIKLKDMKEVRETSEPQMTRLLSKEDSSSPTPPPPDETTTTNNPWRTPDTNVDPPTCTSCVVANPKTLPSHDGEGDIGQGVSLSSEQLASDDLPHHRSQYPIEGASQDDIPASLQCTQPSIRTYIPGCGPPLPQHMNPTIPSSPPKSVQSYGMPLLECNENLSTTTTTTASTVHSTTQFNSRLPDATGTCTIQRGRPQPGFHRQSSLPTPPRPCILIPQAQQQGSGQSPQLRRPIYNTNTTTSSTTIHSLTPDNDLECQRQLQWSHQGQATTARMNSSDSTNSTHSRTSVTSTHTPSVDFTHNNLPPPEHAYVHANPNTHNTAAQHQPMNAATGHHHGPQNFHRLESGESSHSLASLTPESRPESGHQTGSMLVTGTYN